jgi:hypothetical protein
MKGGLRLDARDSILKGGETGPAAVSGQPDESLLIEAVNYGDTLQMPPKSRLAPEEVATLTRWVALGLPWPAEVVKASGAKPGFDLEARKAAHWAWRSIEPGRVPEVKYTGWPLGPIDRYLLAGLEGKGLTPAPEAEKRVLIRRLSFDLTGLPPVPEEVVAFERDASPDAYERLVDRLLASPRFGERWGRHWLDLVRYAETRGHEFDPLIPNAWQYRDYVIRALNQDVPYDQFVTEHLAGDLMEVPRLDPKTGANESILGTGFWFLGEEVHSPVDIRQDETDRMDNRLDVMSKTFLGLTVACARCHDHKFDAISQRDYYALSGFLISSSYRQVRFQTLERERQAASSLQRLHDEARAKILPLAARALGPAIDRLAEDLLVAAGKDGGVVHGEVNPWIKELERASQDREHLFHGFASVALDPSLTDSRLLASRLTQPVRHAPAQDQRVVIDFGSQPRLDRWQDGVSYGLSPVRPGDLWLDVRKEGQIRAGVHDLSAAVHDPVWSALNLGSGPQRDQGKLGTWDRSSQTIRTPEFTLDSGRLWYLVRGAGRAYSAVNSHLVIAGPLHGALLTEWPEGPSRGWRWVRHDLTAYKGHRLHVEFSPSGTGESAIAMVVDSDSEPNAIEEGDRLLRRVLAEGGPIESIEALARRCQSALSSVLGRMETGAFDESPASCDAASMASWMLGRLDLFSLESTTERIALREELAAWNRLRTEAVRGLATTPATAPAMLDGNGVNEHLLIRGSSKTPGPKIPRRFLQAIAGDSPIACSEGSGSGRRELARQILERTNPFARRVYVNRVWHHLFGTGLVRSVDNFGVMGDPPSHPELLDYLADAFIHDGWSTKRLIRSIVLSRAYQMSSQPGEQESLDPQNRLLHRMALRRLEAEPIRDTILAVSGRLDTRMHGSSVPIHLTAYMQGRGRPEASGPLDGNGRRSLYIEVRRNFLSPMMLAFDAPTPFTTIGRRNVSNVPAQALILLNDPFVVDQAGRWADRVLNEEGTAEERVSRMYRQAFSRSPEPGEIASAIGFLKAQGHEIGLAGEAWTTDRRVWADLGHVLINSKEFVFVN